MKQQRISIQLILSPFISQLGSAIFLLGLNWLLVKATGDTKLVGIITGIGGIMFVVGDFIAASVVDHHDRKRVLVASDAISALACLLGAWLITPAAPQTWLLILVTAILDFMISINFPAAKAITPDIIAPFALQRFNALANTVFSLANIVSPLIGGVLLASKVLDFKGFLLVNAGSFIIAGLLNASLKTPRFKPAKTKGNLVGDAVSGLRFVFASRELTQLMIGLGAFNFCYAGYLLAAPYMADRFFAGRPTAYSNFLLASAFGGLIGGILLSLQKRRVSAKQVYAEQLVAGVLLVFLGFQLNHLLWLVVALINGAVNAQLFASLTTLMQGLTPREMLGRVFGLIYLVYDGVQPLGNLFFGQFIHVWQAHTYTILGLVLLIAFGLLLWQARKGHQNAATL